jgi:hypothetical protein
MAVFSLAVAFYMENGLLGALAILGVVCLTIRSILRSSAVALGLCGLGTWLFGTGVTTSYLPLSSLWLFLGALLSWDHLFPPRPAVRPGVDHEDQDSLHH